jgi:hypothetical protein
MKSLNVRAFAVAAILCVTPLSLRWSHGDDVSLFPLSAVFNSVEAAELNLPVRHHRAVVRYGYRAYYARLYNPYCNGPYTGGGWNGGTYYGGMLMDLRCYGVVY